MKITMNHVFFMNFSRSEEHTSELQSRSDLVCRLLLEKKKIERAREVEVRRHPGRDARRWNAGSRMKRCYGSDRAAHRAPRAVISEKLHSARHEWLLAR